MKRILLLLTFLCSLGLTSLAATDWSQVAVITGDDINVREKPSATSRPLGYISTGSIEEEGCWIPDFEWKPATLRKGRFVNAKLYSGMTLPFLGREGDWINVVVYGQPAWIMGKYASVRDITPLRPRMDFGVDNAWVQNILGIMEDGRVIYVENEMDSFIYFGKLVDGKVVIDRYIEGDIRFDPALSAPKSEGSEGWRSFIVGKSWNVADDGYTVSVHSITPDKYDWLYSYSIPFQAGKGVYLTGNPEGGLEVFKM